jgi:hypothetical protein
MHQIHNARIQLLATALNNLGVGSLLAGIVVPWVNGSLSGGVAGWYVFGVLCAVTAQVVLGEMR